MSFGWNRKVKIEKLDASKRRMISQTTPKEVVSNPFGFRQEDIINSLCIVVSELMMESEAKAESLKNIKNLLGDKNEKESCSEESDKKENDKENSETRERNIDNSHIIYNSQPS